MERCAVPTEEALGIKVVKGILDMIFMIYKS